MRRGRCGRFFLAAALAFAQGSIVRAVPTEPLSGPSEAQTKSPTARAAAAPSAEVPDVNPLPSGLAGGGLGLGTPSAPPGTTEGSRIFASPPGEEVLRGLPINLASACSWRV